jgi:hypothetical protein
MQTGDDLPIESINPTGLRSVRFHPSFDWGGRSDPGGENKREAWGFYRLEIFILLIISRRVLEPHLLSDGLIES